MMQAEAMPNWEGRGLDLGHAGGAPWIRRRLTGTRRFKLAGFWHKYLLIRSQISTCLVWTSRSRNAQLLCRAHSELRESKPLSTIL